MNLYPSTIPGPSYSTLWYVCSHANPEAQTRLFFFPYAGGGPSVFSRWLNDLPGDMEGYIAHYPGRGSRYQEPPIKRLTTLVERLYQAIQPLLDKPFAFFGHSLGGLVAFELIKNLRKNNFPQPTILFVSASDAPHLYDVHQPIHKLPDAEFLQTMKELNGISAELQNYPDMMNLLLPMLRADFEASESYDYVRSEPLNIPVVVFGGLDDPRVTRERLEGWALHTNASFKLQCYPGDHFFINTARESVIDSIINDLASSHAKN